MIYFCSENQVKHPITKDSAGFITYLNYLKSLSTYLEKGNNVKIQLKQIVQTSEFNRFCHRKNKIEDEKVDKIFKLLRNSWLTEQQMHQNKNESTYIKIANHWVCIQAYYAIYLSIRAFFIVKNNSADVKHADNLRAITNLIENQPKVFPDPWKILCINDESSYKAFRYLNLPKGVIINHNDSSLKSNTEFYDSYTRLLRTTRERLLEEEYNKVNNGTPTKRILFAEKTNKAKKFYATSFFNFLYRLRIRSNYKDADMFIFSDTTENNELTFYESLLKTTDFTLLMLETLIYRIMTKKSYEKIFSEFIMHLKRGYSGTYPVEQRYEFIKDIMC